MIERFYLIFEILAVLLCLHGLYGEKFKWNIYTISFIGIEFVAYQVDYIYDLPVSIEGFVYLLFLLYSIIQFRAGIKDILINYVLCIILSVLMQLICYIPIFFLYNSVQINVGYLVNILFFFVALMMYCKGILTKMSGFLRSNDKLVMLVICIMAVLVIYALVIIKSNIVAPLST